MFGIVNSSRQANSFMLDSNAAYEGRDAKELAAASYCVIRIMQFTQLIGWPRLLITSADLFAAW